MKSTLIFIAFFLCVSGAYAQVVSSCNAPDSIKAKYQDDADRLALRKILRIDSPYKDSVAIPKVWSDTVLNALLAVYNATSLPARDSVTGKVKFSLNSFASGSSVIHTFGYPDMKDISIAADTGLSWMKQFENGNLVTGNYTIDNLTTKHHLTIDGFENWSSFYNFNVVYLISDSNYNINAMVNLFQKIAGVVDVEPGDVIGDGNDITDSIYPDFVELVYSLGGGDCPSGCTSRRYWKFNVYFDCSVSFIESYGTPVLIDGVNTLNGKNINVSPNPFNNSVAISGMQGEFYFRLYNLYGQLVESGKQDEPTISNLNNLPSGLYFIEVSNNSNNSVFKLSKE